MRVLEVEVVAWTIEVRRHSSKIIRLILPIIGLTHFNSGDLCNGVWVVCLFERAGKGILLSWVEDNRVGKYTMTRGRGACYSTPTCLMYDVGLNHQILINEIGRVGVVREYAADLCGSKKDKFRFLLSEKGLDIGLTPEIKLFTGAQDKISVSV